MNNSCSLVLSPCMAEEEEEERRGVIPEEPKIEHGLKLSHTDKGPRNSLRINDIVEEESSDRGRNLQMNAFGLVTLLFGEPLEGEDSEWLQYLGWKVLGMICIFS